MKWFKHLSNARNDVRLSQLEDVAGLEGYGFYFKLLEIVADAMNETELCEASYSIQKWGHLTNCHPIKARTLVGKVASCGLVEARLDGDRIVVRIPKLLKHRDNYTKNLQVTDKQEEKEKRKEKKQTPLPPSGAVSKPIPDWVPVEAWSGFCEMRGRLRAPLTERAKTLAIAELGKLRDQGHDPRAVLEQSTVRAWRGLFPLKTASDEAAPDKRFEGAL